MKRRISGFGWLLAVLVGLTALLLWQTAGAAELPIGAPLPSFSLPSADGQTVSSSDFGGKRALVVVFLDNHCTYSDAYQGRLIALQNEFSPRGVQFVMINPNAGADAAEMKGHAAKMGYPFPFLLDAGQTVTHAYGATRTPEVFVFDQNHKLVYRGQIDDNTEAKMVRKADLKLALDAVLKGTPQAIEHPVTSVFGCTIKK